MQMQDRDTGERPFFFLHVRKTAGTTLVRRIRGNFPGTDWYPESDARPAMIQAKVSPELLFAQPPARLASTRFFSLHQPLWVRDEVAGRIGVQPFTLTVLREPVERTLSHVKQLAQVSQWTGSLQDFYCMPRVRHWMVWNHQVMQFVQTQRDGEQMAVRANDLFAAPDPDTFDIGTPIVLDADALERAKARLATVDAVGFTENVTEFVDELAARFGWTTEPPLHANVAAPAEVPTRLRALIEADAAADLEFYEHARAVVGTS